MNTAYSTSSVGFSFAYVYERGVVAPVPVRVFKAVATTTQHYALPLTATHNMAVNIICKSI